MCLKDCLLTPIFLPLFLSAQPISGQSGPSSFPDPGPVPVQKVIEPAKHPYDNYISAESGELGYPRAGKAECLLVETGPADRTSGLDNLMNLEFLFRATSVGGAPSCGRALAIYADYYLLEALWRYQANTKFFHPKQNLPL